jgi:hypothetical protein
MIWIGVNSNIATTLSVAAGATVGAVLFARHMMRNQTPTT